jgi:hypothetical protein
MGLEDVTPPRCRRAPHGPRPPQTALESSFALRWDPAHLFMRTFGRTGCDLKYCLKQLAPGRVAAPRSAQRFMSKRAGATVVEHAGSNAIYVSQPRAVAALIEQAAERAVAAAQPDRRPGFS